MRFYFCGVSWAVLVLLNCFALESASARWARLEDAPAISRLDQEEIFVAPNGTYRSVRETLVEIKNDEGRTNFGLTSLKYNSRTTQIKVLEAETRSLAGTAYAVPAEFIEDKPLASSAEGFDETRQIAIAYPRVEVGSKLYLKYEETVREVPFPNFFSTKIFIGSEIPEENSQAVVHSALPLFFQENDPNSIFQVDQKTQGSDQVTTIRVSKSAYFRPVDEEESLLNAHDSTWIVLSSRKGYAFLAEMYAKKYEAILSSPLPPAFEKIFEQAKTKPDLVSQMNSVTSLLADQVRYLGDWRPTDGGHVPRSLERIASTKFGDCKDFSVVTGAIARKLGFTAHVAWVERGTHPTPLSQIAYDAGFNHAIVAISEKKGTRWIDATNFASFAQGTFDDLLGRQALIIDPGHSHLETLSVGSPKDAQITRKLEFFFEKEGDAVIDATLEYLGRSSVSLTGIGRELSKESVTHFISQTLSDNNLVRWSKLEDYDLTSRIVADITIKAKVSVKALSLRTTAGFAFQLGWEDLGRLVNLDTAKRISDFFLGPPETLITNYRLSKIRIVGKLPRSCTVDSPWVSVSRNFTFNHGDVQVVDRREIRSLSIRPEEFKGEVFEAFQGRLRNCFQPIALVYKEPKTKE